MRCRLYTLDVVMAVVVDVAVKATVLVDPYAHRATQPPRKREVRFMGKGKRE